MLAKVDLMDDQSGNALSSVITELFTELKPSIDIVDWAALVTRANENSFDDFETEAQSYLTTIQNQFIELLKSSQEKALKIDFGIPFMDPLVSIPTKVALSAFWLAVIGLSLNQAAYIAEILRALDAVQQTDGVPLATPANWVPGQDVIVALSLDDAAAVAKYGELDNKLPYLRFAKAPQKG